MSNLSIVKLLEFQILRSDRNGFEQAVKTKMRNFKPTKMSTDVASPVTPRNVKFAHGPGRSEKKTSTDTGLQTPPSSGRKLERQFPSTTSTSTRISEEPLSRDWWRYHLNTPLKPFKLPGGILVETAAYKAWVAKYGASFVPPPPPPRARLPTTSPALDPYYSDESSSSDEEDNCEDRVLQSITSGLATPGASPPEERCHLASHNRAMIGEDFGADVRRDERLMMSPFEDAGNVATVTIVSSQSHVPLPSPASPKEVAEMDGHAKPDVESPRFERRLCDNSLLSRLGLFRLGRLWRCFLVVLVIGVMLLL